MSTKPEGASWETRKSALVGVLKAGLHSSRAQNLLRKLCEAGDAQLCIEAGAEVLLSAALLQGAVPQNAGVLSKDLAYACEAALLEVAEAYFEGGTPLVRYASVAQMHAELCKLWLRSFAPPIPETLTIRGTLSDPEVQDRLTVVALALREFVEARCPLYNGVHTIELEGFEGFCHDAATLMFNAFEKPNDTNHQLIHGSKPDAG